MRYITHIVLFFACCVLPLQKAWSQCTGCTSSLVSNPLADIVVSSGETLCLSSTITIDKNIVLDGGEVIVCSGVQFNFDSAYSFVFNNSASKSRLVVEGTLTVIKPTVYQNLDLEVGSTGVLQLDTNVTFASNVDLINGGIMNARDIDVLDEFSFNNTATFTADSIFYPGLAPGDSSTLTNSSSFTVNGALRARDMVIINTGEMRADVFNTIGTRVISGDSIVVNSLMSVEETRFVNTGPIRVESTIQFLNNNVFNNKGSNSLIETNRIDASLGTLIRNESVIHADEIINSAIWTLTDKSQVVSSNQFQNLNSGSFSFDGIGGCASINTSGAITILNSPLTNDSEVYWCGSTTSNLGSATEDCTCHLEGDPQCFAGCDQFIVVDGDINAGVNETVCILNDVNIMNTSLANDVTVKICGKVNFKNSFNFNVPGVRVEIYDSVSFESQINLSSASASNSQIYVAPGAKLTADMVNNSQAVKLAIELDTGATFLLTAGNSLANTEISVGHEAEFNMPLPSNLNGGTVVDNNGTVNLGSVQVNLDARLLNNCGESLIDANEIIFSSSESLINYGAILTENFTSNGKVEMYTGSSLTVTNNFTCNFINTFSYVGTGSCAKVDAQGANLIITVGLTNDGEIHWCGPTHALLGGATESCTCNDVAESCFVPIVYEADSTISVTSLSLCEGESSTLSVDNETYNAYQWYSHSGPISGATSSNLSVSLPSSYWVTITNTDGTTQSDTVAIDVSSVQTDSIVVLGDACVSDSVKLMVADPAGTYVVLDGANDFFTIPDNSLFDFGSPNDFTLEVMLRPRSLGAYQGVFMKREDPSGLGYSMSITPTGEIIVSLSGQSGGKNITSTGTVDLNLWQRIVVTIDRDGDCVVYKNGIEIGRGDASGVGNINNSAMLSLGAGDFELGASIIGKLNADLAEFAVWSGALDSAFLVQKELNQTLGIEDDLLGLWNFADLSDSTLVQPHIEGLPGTVHGAPTYIEGDAFFGAGNVVWKRNGTMIPGADTSFIWVKDDGTYSVDWSNDNCSGTVTSASINFAGNIDLGATLTDSILCDGETAQLSLDYLGTGTFSWLKDGVVLSGESSTTLSIGLEGQYQGIINNDFCEDTTAGFVVYIVAIPDTSITKSAGFFCAGDSITMSVSDVDSLSYNWIRNGASLGIDSSFVVLSLAGSYQVDIDNGQCVTSSGIHVVTEESLPIVSEFSSGIYSVCSADTLLQAFAQPEYTYNWIKDDVAMGEIGSDLLVLASGRYRVAKTTGLCVDTSADVSIRLIPTPGVSLSFVNDSMCSGDTMLLSTVDSDTLSYSWRQNGVDLPNTDTSVNSAINAGDFHVKVSSSLCVWLSDTVSIETINFPSAALNVSGSKTICDGDSLELSLINPSAERIDWHVNGSVSGFSGTSQFVNAGGAYRAVLSNFTCADTSQVVDLTVVQQPDTSVAVSANEACAGDLVTLTAQPGNGYTWIINSIVSGETSAEVSISSTSTIELIVDNGACTASSAARVVTFHDFANVDVTVAGDGILCEGQTEILSVSSPGSSSYQWLRNDVELAGEIQSQFTTADTGTFKVIGVNQICSDTSAGITLTSVESPDTVLSSSTITICTGDTGTVFVLEDVAATYAWELDNVLVGTESSLDVIAQGSYQLTITKSVCSYGPISLTADVKSGEIDLLSITNAICDGDSVRLDASVQDVTSINWNMGSVSLGDQGSSYFATESGEYWVSGLRDNCPASSDSISISIAPDPNVIIAIDSVVFCDGQSATVTASASQNSSFIWFLDGAVLIGETGTSLAVSSGGVYAVEATLGNCIGYDSSYVEKIVLLAEIDAFKTELCEGEDLVITSDYSGDNITWFMDAEELNEVADSLTVTTIGAYKFTVESKGCLVESGVVEVSWKTEGCFPVEVFNLVTPNGDGIHDVLTIDNIEEYPDNEISIYNRWGDEIYSKTGYDNENDTFTGNNLSGNPLPTGNYFYKLRAEGIEDVLSGYIYVKQ